MYYSSNYDLWNVFLLRLFILSSDLEVGHQITLDGILLNVVKITKTFLN